MKPDWRIFYSDGSTFDNIQGEPHEAPSEGFICAVGYEQRQPGVAMKRYIMHGWDFYRFEQGQWWGMNLPGLLDNLRRNNVYAYKEGRTVHNAEWAEITRAATDDPDFPIKREIAE